MSEGLFPNQIGEPGYEGHLSDRVVSMATLLRDTGIFYLHVREMAPWRGGRA